jgi:hypothetical protein
VAAAAGWQEKQRNGHRNEDAFEETGSTKEEDDEVVVAAV